MAKKMAPQAFEAMRAAMETLAQRYPKAFPRRSIDVKPLMVGIANAILVDLPELRPHLGRALQWWTSRPPYLDACTVGAARIDLAGAAVGAVSEGEAAFAASRLAKRLERIRRKTPAPAAVPVAKVPPAPDPPETPKPAPPQPRPIPASPKRLSLADLKAAYRLRQQAGAA
jgi:ProP effector